MKIYKIFIASIKIGGEILDFPCDQFGHQAPGSNDEIATFCSARFEPIDDISEVEKSIVDCL